MIIQHSSDPAYPVLNEPRTTPITNDDKPINPTIEINSIFRSSCIVRSNLAKFFHLILRKRKGIIPEKRFIARYSGYNSSWLKRHRAIIVNKMIPTIAVSSGNNDPTGSPRIMAPNKEVLPSAGEKNIAIG